jgi:hypothetical protein
MALKTMPIAKLQTLKSQVEAAISAKVTERRRELELELSKLGGIRLVHRFLGTDHFRRIHVIHDGLYPGF